MRWPAPLAALAADRRRLVELFVVSNLAFLVVDVWIAHSVNDFRQPLEWLPVAFAAVGSLALAVALVAGWRERGALWRWFGLAVGWGAIAVGVGGLLLHLEGRFFQQSTLEGLVYSAPFAAPLAFAGLGFLLLADRMLAPGDESWGRWVLFFALGGFVGNFALSLADHAQNGFFFAREWISVVAAALAVGFLAVAVAKRRPDRALAAACWWLLAFEVAVGLLGFAWHLAAAFEGPAEGFATNALYGAPVFAPLLFADLAALAALGLWETTAGAATIDA